MDMRTVALTAAYRIPEYARTSLFVRLPDGRNAPVAGEHGQFTAVPVSTDPDDVVTVYFGDPDTPDQASALTTLPASRLGTGTLAWDGQVRTGGYIDALHLMALPALEQELAVLTAGTQPVDAAQEYVLPPYPHIARASPAAYAQRFEAAVRDMPETPTFWLVPGDSGLTALAQDALVSKLRVLLSGRLAPDARGWHTWFPLPLALDGMTVFAP
jgi:hypothetical protein